MSWIHNTDTPLLANALAMDDALLAIEIESVSESVYLGRAEWQERLNSLVAEKDRRFWEREDMSDHETTELNSYDRYTNGL